MILYRLQASDGETWYTLWFPTLATAKATEKDFDQTVFEVKIDKIDIPSGRDGLALALNNAEVNRMNWPGEEI